MVVSIEKAIKWFESKKGKVTYSMAHRDGPNSYDCSSSIYYALRSAGATNAGWAVNTEYEHEWLLKNGFERVANNKTWTAKRGDIFIWGKKGASSGAGGHTGIFISGEKIIHCNYGQNGVSIGNHDSLWFQAGQPYFYAYRLKGSTPQPTKKGWNKDEDGWWYVNSDETYPVNEFFRVGSNWYFANEKGYILENSWKQYNKNWYWLKSGGYMAKSETLTINGKQCYFNSWGALVSETKYYRQ